MGRRCAMIAKVGADSFGRLLLDTLERAGVCTDGAVCAGDAFTTLAFVTLDSRGEREFSFARKPGADTLLRPEELDEALIKGSRLFHFGSLSLTDEPARSATERALALAREGGAAVSFDPNYRPPLWRGEGEARERMLWGLARADVVKLSAEEAAFSGAAARRRARGASSSSAAYTYIYSPAARAGRITPTASAGALPPRPGCGPWTPRAPGTSSAAPRRRCCSRAASRRRTSRPGPWAGSPARPAPRPASPPSAAAA